MDTIYALSSGQPPAGIGIIRVTGDRAAAVLQALTGAVPAPRRAVRAVLRGADGDVLDDGLALYFPGPHSVTGEDIAEFHCHGGRAVIAAVERAIGAIAGCRPAAAGEFTRRAFANGRIDLAEAEGLGDLLAAETELQRRNAVSMATGAFSRQIEGWRETLLRLSAQIEAVLDFDDEDDVGDLPQSFAGELEMLTGDLQSALAAPRAELLKEGFRVALAGPPNAGKSTLFNALVEREAAITADISGTTRDVLTQSVALAGIPFTFVDMAGLRDAAETRDPIEAIGIARAGEEIARADVVLWLGEEGQGPAQAWEIDAQCDRGDHARKREARVMLSARTGEGMDSLRNALIACARDAMPKPGETALNTRQRALLEAAASSLVSACVIRDPLLVGEHLRLTRTHFDALTGRSSTEDVLDTLFGRFCIGK